MLALFMFGDKNELVSQTVTPANYTCTVDINSVISQPIVLELVCADSVRAPLKDGV